MTTPRNTPTKKYAKKSPADSDLLADGGTPDWRSWLGGGPGSSPPA